MKNYDLDFNAVIIGSARGSKSTLLLQLARRIYANDFKMPLNRVDLELIQNGWVYDKIIYTKKQGFAPLKSFKNEVIGLDDAILIGDRRSSMDQQQIKFNSWLNYYASNNNRVFSLIQNLSDLDYRLYSKANAIFLVYERGRALVYIKPKNFPIIKDTYDFDRFVKSPYLLNNEDTGLFYLKRLHSYVGAFSFKDLSGNSLYQAYLTHKKTNQEGLE